MVAPVYLRDRYMYKNIEFLLNLIAPVTKKAIIYAHFGHTNPKSNQAFNPASLSFGSYMKQKYKEDYYSIAILTANGKFRTTDKDSLLVKGSLELPVDNSLEKSLSSLGEDYCFMPVSVLTPEILRIRHVGNSYTKNQFNMIAPASRMDGLIYIQNSKEFDVLKGTPVLLQNVNRYQINQILKTMKK
jgi:erythromycin esterase-like protein